MAAQRPRRNPTFDSAAWKAIVDLAIRFDADPGLGRVLDGQLARRMAEAILALGEHADPRPRELPLGR